MEWFNAFGDVSQARREASPQTRFQAYTMTSTTEDAIKAEIKEVQAATVVEEKKE